MSLFDRLFFNVFNYYRFRKNRKANRIAIIYITIVHCTLLLFSGICIALFLNAMNTNTLSSNKAWTLFIMASIFLYFKNWIQYSGKKRKVLNAKVLGKQKFKPDHPIFLLWLLPIGTLAVSLILLYIS